MDFKDFIIGEKYNISALAIEGSFAMKKYAVFKLPTGRILLLRAEDFEAVSHENGIKNTETAPKYDPNRLFRKGDKVKAVLRHGRIPNDGVPKDAILEVIEDERDGIVKVLHKMGVILEIFNVYALYLELVTPVEELEPYSVVDAHTHWDVADKNMKTVATYSKGHHPHAKEAAEAERDRLNAEYKKEQK